MNTASIVLAAVFVAVLAVLGAASGYEKPSPYIRNYDGSYNSPSMPRYGAVDAAFVRPFRPSGVGLRN